MLETYLKIFSIFQFEIIQILVILPKNAISLWIIHEIGEHFCKCMGGCYIHHISNRFCHVTFRSPSKNGNIDGGAGECNFSLKILKENWLLLHLPNNFSHTIDAWIEKHACMVPIRIVIMATYLQFISNSPFWWNSDFSDFTQKFNFSVHYEVNCLTILGWIVGKHMQHISKGFCHITFSSYSRMSIHALMPLVA